MSVEGFLLGRKRIRNSHCMYQLLPKNPDKYDLETAASCFNTIAEAINDDKRMNGVMYALAPPGYYWSLVK